MERPCQPGHPHPSRTTSAGRPTSLDKTLATNVKFREVHPGRLLVHEEGDPSRETASYTLVDGTRFDRLTATSLAVLVDSEHDGLLMLPLMLNLGGDIQQIDSLGRTLLHFCTYPPRVPLSHRTRGVRGLGHAGGTSRRIHPAARRAHVWRRHGPWTYRPQRG